MKKVFFGIGIGILFVIVVSLHIAAAWFIYSTFFVTKNSETSKQNDQTATIVIDVLSEIQTKTEQSQAWANYNISRFNESDQQSNTFVYTNADELNLPLGIEPTASLRISQTSGVPFDTTSFSTAEENITSVLAASDIVKVEIETPQEILSSYTGKGMSCSLTGTLGSTYATLACIEDSALNSSASTVKELFALQQPSLSDVAYLQFKERFDNPRTHAVALIDISQSEIMRTSSLVYTYENKTWSYVDDALSAKPGESGGGKIAAPQKVESLSKDPIYGPLFLSLFNAKI